MSADQSQYGALSYRHARTRSRVFALRLLYQEEMTGARLEGILAQHSSRLSVDRLQECLSDCEARDGCELYAFFTLFDREPDSYALALVSGVEEHQREIDRLIRDASEHWAVSRMPVVDRCILRLAVFEICFSPDLPAQVSINEAVQLAKEYGGQDSPKFVNGLLGKIARGLDEPVQ
ncbi:MAG: transcription antitermination factor NusB [Actinomycetia bacterium]|nr:transcription antitermination factor NusB [Actinomycetes bacterium]